MRDFVVGAAQVPGFRPMRSTELTGDAMRLLRSASGMTQRELAKAADVSAATIRRAEAIAEHVRLTPAVAHRVLLVCAERGHQAWVPVKRDLATSKIGSVTSE